MKALKGIVELDVFVVLPADYVENACFQSLPLVYDQLLPENDLCFITADPSHARHSALHGESICTLAVAPAHYVGNPSAYLHLLQCMFARSVYAIPMTS